MNVVELRFKILFSAVSHKQWFKRKNRYWKMKWLRTIADAGAYTGGTSIKTTSPYVVRVYKDDTNELEGK